MRIFKKGLSMALAMLMLFMMIPFTGYTAYATAVDGGFITLGNPTTVNIENGGDNVALKFTPTETGKYKFELTTTEYLSLDSDLLDENNYIIADGPSYVVDLTAGQTYTLYANILYSDTGSFQVVVRKPIVVTSIEMHDVKAVEYKDLWKRTYYGPEPGQEREYNHYSFPMSYTVYYSDGTSIDKTGSGISDDLGSYSLYINSDQSPDNEWGIGFHTAKAYVDELGYEAEFQVEIVENPIDYIVAGDVYYVDGYQGENDTDSKWDDELGWTETPEYFKYYNVCPDVTIYMDNGDVLNQTYIEYDGTTYGFSFDYQQSYDNQWLVNNSYTCEGKIFGVPFNYQVHIIDTPITNVVVNNGEPIQLFKDIDSYSTYDDWNGDDTLWYDYYRYGLSENDIDITFLDGYGVEKQDLGLIFNDQSFEYPSEYDIDQNYENRWLPGNTYTVKAELLGYEYEYQVEIIGTPISYVEISAEPITEKTNGSLSGEGDESYYHYSIPSYSATIYMKNGEIIHDNYVEWNDGRCFYLEINDPQSYENQFHVGINKVPFSIMGYEGTFDLEIIPNPISEIYIPDKTVYSGFDSYTTTSSLYDEFGNYIGESEEFEIYNAWPVNPTITMRDGTVYHQNNFEHDGINYDISVWDNQNYENKWEVGGTYPVEAYIGGLSYTYYVTVESDPISSITIETEPIVEKTNGYLSGEGNDSYYHYYMPSFTTTIQFKNGESATGDNYVYWNGMEFYVEIDDPQSIDNQFVVGKNSVPFKVGTYEGTFELEITQSPILSIQISDITLIEDKDNWATTDAIYDENGYVGQSEPYNKYNVWPQNIIVEMRDGTTITEPYFWYNDTWYEFSVSDPQSYDNQWKAGETYTVYGHLGGFVVPFNVTINPNPIESVVIEPIIKIENFGGYYTTTPYWDDEKGENYYSPEWFCYDDLFQNANITINLSNGETITGQRYFEYNGEEYYINYDSQSYDNRLVLGTNTYNGNLFGKEFTFNIEVISTPVANITMENDIILVENYDGYYTHTYTWDEESGTEIQSPEFFSYHNVWYNMPNIHVEFKDGTSTDLNGQFYITYNGVEYYINEPNQEYFNRYLLGDNERILNILGYEFPVNVKVIKSPIASIEIDRINLTEGKNGDYSSDDLYDENGNYIGQSDLYFHYYGYWPESNTIKITMMNGDSYTGEYVEWKGGRYWLFDNIKGQSYNNQLQPGLNIVEGNVLGFDFTYEIYLSEATANDEYEYTVTDDGVIITDSYIDPETLEIPAEIDGKPVIGVADLGWSGMVKHLIFPDSVKTIGNYLLSNRFSGELESITFGSGIDNLTPEMFNDLWWLNEIIVSEDNENYATIDGVLYDKNITKLIAYPLEKGNQYVVPDSVSDLSAFDHYCYANIDLIFSETHPNFITIEGVTYNQEMTKVISCAKSKTGSYTMPETVTEIAERAFFNSNLSEIIVSSKVTEIVYCTFASCANLTNIELPSGLVSIGTYAFDSTYSLESIELPETLETIGSYAFYQSGLTSLNLPDSVKSVESYAFSNSNIANLDLGNGIESIGYEAFRFIPAESVTLPDSLTYLGGNAFYNCRNLHYLTIGSGLDSISSGAFAHSHIYELYIPGTIKYISSGAFEFSGTEVVTFGEGINVIDSYAFANNNNLINVTLPASLIDINPTAFENCGALKYLNVANGNPVYHSSGSCVIETASKTLVFGCPYSVIPDDGSVTKIGRYAFKNSTIELLNLPNTITDIEPSAFYNCDGLKKVIIPDSVKVIDLYAFQDCDNLEYVLIGNGVEEINASAFAGCSNLEVDLGNSVAYIAPRAFSNTGIKDMFIPDSVTTIMYDAFIWCKNLTSVELPLSVETIEQYAFSGCDNLTDVYYEGSEADRENINIYDGNENLLNANWHYNHVSTKWNAENCDHKYTNGCDTTCNTCGSTRGIVHNWSGIGHDEDGHWVACSVCGERQSMNTTGTHAYNQQTVADEYLKSAASCSSAAEYYKSCVCGEKGTDTFTSGSKLAHKSDGGTVTKKATCSAAGTKTYKCTLCKATIKTESIAKLSHKSDGGTVTKKATCTATGTKTYKCTLCKTTIKTESIAKLSHSYKTTTTKATTSKDGSAVTKCTACGKVASTTTIKYAKTFTLSATSYTYDGKVKTPGVTVKDSAGKVLKKDTDYTVSYASGRKNIGTYNVTIKMMGNYTGTKTLTFSINPKIKLSGTSYTYDGKTKTPTVTVTNSSGTKISSKYYTVTYSSGRKDVGTYTVAVKFTNGHSGTYKYDYKINPVDVSKCSIKLSATSYTYDGKTKTPSVTVKNAAGTTLKKDVDYTVKYASGRKNAGTYNVTVTMKGNYTGTKTLTFEINPIDISKSNVKLSATSYSYNGSVKTPSVTVQTSSGTKLTKNTHYTVSYSSGRKNVGTYKVTIKGKGNYTGTKVLTYKINPPATTVSKLTAGSKSITVGITKKSTQVTGYQIQYSTSSKFTNATTKNVTSYKTTSYTLKNLSAKKTYYVRVRTYKKVGSTTYYSGWSTYKYVKTK